jgi:hypothetical protein
MPLGAANNNMNANANVNDNVDVHSDPVVADHSLTMKTTISQIEIHRHRQHRPKKARFPTKVLLLFLLLLLLPDTCQAGNPIKRKAGGLAIASHRREYETNSLDNIDMHSNSNLASTTIDASFCFGRFQSPHAVKRALDKLTGRSTATAASSFKFFQGKDGRKGNVSSTKLGGDWVLAESEQIAVYCTTEEVLEAYLSGDLQKRWNTDTVLDCKITKRHRRKGGEQQHKEAYYQQDLVLRSQRIIRRHTGIMRYSQRIAIDKIGMDDKCNDYCVSIRLDPSASTTTSQSLKPFESLSVYVNLQQEGSNVRVYAAGIMEVNRRVVPNLVIFDASGIAGSMAGKGTLWLGAYFDVKKKASSLEPPPPPLFHQQQPNILQRLFRPRIGRALLGREKVRGGGTKLDL